MFHSNFAEQQCHEVYLDIEDPQSFEIVLRYLYQDPSFELTKYQEYEIQNIVQIADYFEIRALLFEIENHFLHQYITQKTFPEFISEYVGFTRLRELQQSKLKQA